MPSDDNDARREFLRALAALKPRHLWVLERVVEGKPNKAIAAEHDPSLAVHTVENYVSEILEATGCESRTVLIVSYFRCVEQAGSG